MKLRTWIQKRWRLIGLFGGAAVLSGGLLLIRLGSLTDGISNREAQLHAHSSSLYNIAHDPIGLPLTILQWLAGLLPLHNSFGLRLPSVIVALVALGCMTYTMRRWYGPRTAAYGFFLFLASAWFLHVGRLATMDILLLCSLPILLAAQLLLHQHSGSRFVGYVWLITSMSLLYAPGMIWFVTLNAIWQREQLKTTLLAFRSWFGKLGLLIGVAILLAPLAYGLVTGPTGNILLAVAGLPQTMPGLETVAKNLGHALLFVVVRGTAPDDVWLNHLPVLGAFLTTTLIAGGYFYAQHLQASRTKRIITVLLAGLALVSLGGPVTLGLVVPLLYLISAAGIAYLLHLWLAVFPKNPLARSFGIGLVGITVAFSCLYNLRHYFVAWPHHTDSRAAFSQHDIKKSHL